MPGIFLEGGGNQFRDGLAATRDDDGLAALCYASKQIRELPFRFRDVDPECVCCRHPTPRDQTVDESSWSKMAKKDKMYAMYEAAMVKVQVARRA